MGPRVLLCRWCPVPARGSGYSIRRWRSQASCRGPAGACRGLRVRVSVLVQGCVCVCVRAYSHAQPGPQETPGHLPSCLSSLPNPRRWVRGPWQTGVGAGGEGGAALACSHQHQTGSLRPSPHLLPVAPSEFQGRAGGGLLTCPWRRVGPQSSVGNLAAVDSTGVWDRWLPSTSSDPLLHVPGHSRGPGPTTDQLSCVC